MAHLSLEIASLSADPCTYDVFSNFLSKTSKVKRKQQLTCTNAAPKHLGMVTTISLGIAVSELQKKHFYGAVHVSAGKTMGPTELFTRAVHFYPCMRIGQSDSMV